MSNIALVSCVRKKQTVKCAARDLYQSAWFRKARSIASTKFDTWWILSAKHGLIEPDTLIEPYDVSLRDLSAGERLAWAKSVVTKLESIVRSGDSVTIFAGSLYWRYLVPILQERGIQAALPMKGLSIGRQLSRLNSLDRQTSVPASVARFYGLLEKLATGQKGGMSLSLESQRVELPRRGVYFFLDPEERLDFDPSRLRVVRVGTHAVSAGSKSTLRQRLRTHVGGTDLVGSHRSSVFRLHVGRALITKERIPNLTSWGVGSVASVVVREQEVGLEKRVSEYIRRMSVLWLDIPDEPGPRSDRAFIEQNSIALLSRYAVDHDLASAKWLGRHSTHQRIRSSALWNLNYVSLDHTDSFLEVLAYYVDATLGLIPHRSGSRAPRHWRLGKVPEQPTLF